MKLTVIACIIVLAGCDGGSGSPTLDAPKLGGAEPDNEMPVVTPAAPRTTLPSDFPSDVFVYPGMDVQIAQRLPNGFSIIGKSSSPKQEVLADIRAGMAARGWEEQEGNAQSQLMQATRFVREGRMTSVSLFDTQGATSIRIDVQAH